jgi:hypothetical protein
MFPKLFDDPSLLDLPQSYNRDIVKVLIQNPKVTYILWDTKQFKYQEIIDSWRIHSNEINLILELNVILQNGTKFISTIHLPPFTTSYYYRSEDSIKFLHAKLIVEARGRKQSLLESPGIELPHHLPSTYVDPSWILDEWKPFLQPESNSVNYILTKHPSYESKNFLVLDSKNKELIKHIDGSSHLSSRLSS